MTNKESLREKFVNAIHKQHINFQYPSDFENTLDFFWNEIQQIRKEDMERVVEQVNKLYIYEDQSPSFIRDEILSIIKQAHE